MRVHVFVVIVSLLGLLPANADDIGAEFDPRPNCGGLTYFVDAPVGQSREVGIGVSVKNYRALLNAETLVSLLNRAAAAGFAQCQADAVAVFITKVGGPLPGRGEPLVTAWKYRSEPQWRIVHNNVSQLVRQEDAQKAASGARVQRFAKFVSDFGITDGVGPETLAANPFAYKGKTVGVRTTFDKMVSEKEAFFGNIFVSQCKFQKARNAKMIGRVDDDGPRRLLRLVRNGLSQKRRINGWTGGTAGKAHGGTECRASAYDDRRAAA